MYFPQLRRLNVQFEMDHLAVKLLDSWLAIQRQAVLHNLSPIRFSVQSDVDVDLAIDMFSLAAHSDVGVLLAKYKVLCPRCEEFNGAYHSLVNLPQVCTCRECGTEFNPSGRLDFVELVFERMLMPARPIQSNQTTDRGGQQGNGPSLRVSDVAQRPSSARRHLLNGLDTRYEAGQ